MENLIVEIGASTKEFIQGIGEVGEHAKSLEDKLKGIGVVAATAFAGYTASIMGTVYAYHEQEKVGLEIDAILKATGGVAGVTSEQIDHLAESLSRSTTFSALQVKRGEEMLLTFTRIGKDTFPAAAQAVLDLAQKMGGDAAGAANMLGRALQDPEAGMKKLARQGIIFTETQKAQVKAMEESGNMAGAQAVIIGAVEAKYGGMAQAAAGGTGSILQLKNTMEALAEKIGAEFAPYVSKAATFLKDLMDAAADNKGITEAIALFLSAGAALSGTVVALVAGTFAFKQITQAMEVAKFVTQALGLSMRGLVGATGIGLLLIVAYEVYEHWGKIWPAMFEIFHNFVTNISAAGEGLARILKGVFMLDEGEIKAGLAQVGAAFVNAATGVAHTVAGVFKSTPEARDIAEKTGKELGNAEGKAFQIALMKEEDALRKLKFQATAATHAAELLALSGHTAKVVALKKAEAGILSQLADASYEGNKSALRKHLAEIQAEYKREEANEVKQRAAFEKLKTASQLKLNNAEKAALIASIKTQEDAVKQNRLDDLNFQIAADNTQLQEADRYGEAYAAINKAMHSKIVTGTMSATNELVQMQQSSSKELKAIGQAAALYQIGIKGVESAENAYAGFATIPIVGQALGLVAAAAALAFAAENARKVTGMAAGGMVMGGLPGIDSVPILAQQGELVTPKENYNEHIDAMVAKRSGQNGGGGTQNFHHTFSIVGDLARYIQVKTVQSTALGTRRS